MLGVDRKRKRNVVTDEEGIEDMRLEAPRIILVTNAVAGQIRDQGRHGRSKWRTAARAMERHDAEPPCPPLTVGNNHQVAQQMSCPKLFTPAAPCIKGSDPFVRVQAIVADQQRPVDDLQTVA